MPSYASVPCAPVSAPKPPAFARDEAVCAVADESAHHRLAMQVLRQFRSVFGEVRHPHTQREHQQDVGGAQLWALSEIAREPGLGVTDLALQMDVHQSTASNLVRHLLRKGLIRSERASVDRRNVRLSPTTQGLAVLRSAPGPKEGVLPAALQKLSPQELTQLHERLESLLQHLQPLDSAAPAQAR